MQLGSLALLAVVLVGVISRGQQVEAVARLIRVPLTRTTTQRAGSYGQPVVSYHATVSIGTPPKSFKIQFDLDSPESFVPHYSWNPFNTNLHYGAGFQCKSSSTCEKNNNEYVLEYQHVKLTGKRYEDLVSLSEVTLNATTNSVSKSPTWRQNFLAISSASDGRFSHLPIDGFFGLGPAAQSQAGVRSLITSLHTASLLDNLQFSMWFNPVLDSPAGGELILGGVDVNLYQGQIYWHKLAASPAAPSGWALNLQSVSLGNQVIGCAGPNQADFCAVKFSSGLSDIYGPREDLDKIYPMLGTTRHSSGLELINCQRIPSLPFLTFHIDGIPYHLLSSNYIRKTTTGPIFKNETCYLAILPNLDTTRKVWTLSTPFLGAYYSIYDLTYQQIGFASLK